MPHLTFFRNGQPVMRNNLKSQVVTIGRDSSCDIQLTEEDISRVHALISWTDRKFILTDKSTNGTFVNEKSVQNHELKHGDTISISDWRIKFDEDDSSTCETVIRSHQKSSKCEKISTSLGPIIGKSKSMKQLFALASKVAVSDATICITGESGTGKELIARYIHETSSRRTKSYVALNCGAIPSNLIESELFGHERGSFTSATSQHRGVFEQANAGSLFLDEIGEMPIDLQTRLLRVLETKMVKRVGAQAEIPVDVRIITATNKDLKKLVKEKSFREDLFYRLFVMPIEIPPLRDRKNDIEPLAKHFLSDISPDNVEIEIDESALTKLNKHEWPGNVRELKNTIQRAILVSNGSIIKNSDIIFGSTLEEDQTPLDEQEKKSVLGALSQAKGNASEAARQLGIARTTLTSMIKRHNIDIYEFKE